MKKIIPLALALCILLSVCACGKNDRPAPQEPSAYTEALPEPAEPAASEEPAAYTEALPVPAETAGQETAALYRVGDTVSTIYYDFTLEKAVFTEALSPEEYGEDEWSRFSAYTLPAAYDPNADQKVASVGQKFAYIEFTIHNKDRKEHYLFGDSLGFFDSDVGVNFTGVQVEENSYMCFLAVTYEGKWQSHPCSVIYPDEYVHVKACVTLNDPIEDIGTPIDLVFRITEPIDYGKTDAYTFALNY